LDKLKGRAGGKVKIKSVKHWTEDLELTRPYTIAYETISSVVNQFVRIDTDDGKWGIGSASPSPEVTGESLNDCRNALSSYLEPLLLGQETRDLKRLCHETHKTITDAPAACAAIDIALHDLMAKYLNLPLADMLGKVHKSLPTSITIGIQSIEESLHEAEEYTAQGFRIIKLKIGNQLEQDVECLHKLREKFGERVKIRVDANQGYSLDDYKQFIADTESLDIEFTEQPMPVASLNRMHDLPDAVCKRTAADENLLFPADAWQLAKEPQPFGIFNVKLMKCGGIIPALQIARIANSSKIELMWGCNDESVVSITAALHAALASEATRYLDLDGSFDLARDLVTGGFVLQNGELSTTKQPGLGVKLK